MQSAVSPFTVHDLRGGLLEICRAFVACCLFHALLMVDLCGSTDTSLNPLLVTCIMLPKWFGRGGPFYAVWLTSYAASGGEITPFVSIKNFILIFCGGTSFSRTGTAIASGSSQDCCLRLMPDAAGSFRYGAYMKGRWFAGSWAPPQELQSIAYKELFPIVLAAPVWGHLWAKKHILFHSDNEAVVPILNTQTSRVPCLMRLLRSLLFSAAHHSFSFSSQHVPGVYNQLADTLSRFNWQEFWRLAPDAQPLPSLVPPEFLAYLTSPPQNSSATPSWPRALPLLCVALAHRPKQS